MIKNECKFFSNKSLFHRQLKYFTTMMDLLWILLGIIALELTLSFIIFPIKKGKSFYYFRWNNPLYKFHPVIGYVHNPEISYSNPSSPPKMAPRKIFNIDIQTDKNGFLTTYFDIDSLKDPSKLIFCIGSSITAGLEAHHNKTYPAILDSLTQQHGYRCINAGVGGYRSIHEFIYFKHSLLKYNPSIILVYSGFNDFESYGYQVSKPYNPFKHFLSHVLPRNRLEALLSFSSLFTLMRTKYTAVRQRISKKGPYADFDLNSKRAIEEDHSWLEEWKANMKKMIDLCQKENIKFYLVSQISPTYLDATPEAKKYADSDIEINGRFDIFAKINQLLREESIKLCQEEKVAFLDISSDFESLCNPYQGGNYHQQRFSWFTDRGHFTEEGYTLIANFIYNRIKEAL